jgi:hypothetical protein
MMRSTRSTQHSSYLRAGRLQRVGAALAVLLACRNNVPGDPPPATSSPQASAEPVPLSTVTPPTPANSGVSFTDGGAPTTAMRPDRALENDTPALGKETAFYTLNASMRVDWPPIARGPEINGALLEQARRKTEPKLQISVGAGRIRLELEGPGHLLPEGVALLGRHDMLGHVVVFAGGARYRPIAPGSLRRVWTEGRYDAMPLQSVQSSPLPGAGTRAGYRTRLLEVVTQLGKATFEVARVADLEGANLLCRAIVEWMGGAGPSLPCASDELLLHADIHWLPKGSTTFEVQKVARRADPSLASGMAVPPQGAIYTLFELPLASSRTYLSESELAQFHQIVDVPVERNAPRGLLASNYTDGVRVLWLDGVPIAQVAPGASHLVTGLARGRYQVTWRTPEGVSEPPTTVVVPGKIDLGTPDVR